MIHIKKRNLRVIEFLVIGVLFGLIEDIIAVKTVSDAMVDVNVVGTILLIAIPFAIISELIVDHPRFWEFLRIRHEDDINSSQTHSVENTTDKK